MTGDAVMKKLSGLLLLSAAVVATNAAPAIAAEPVITRSTVVKFDDLNLATDAGAQTLYHRITRAAARVCVDASDRFPKSEYRDCMQRAVNNAVAKVDRQTLYVVHQSRSTHPAG
jgi:UrcA family protein